MWRRSQGSSGMGLCLTVLSVLCSAERAHAFFRNLCPGFLAVARVDPIVSPCQLAPHAHFLHGGSNLSFNSSASDLLRSSCSNCLVRQDKSAYWVPSMYFQFANGSFTPVPVLGGLTVYYKLEKRVGALDQVYRVFPPDFRMVAGNSSKRTWNGPFPVPPRSVWNDADVTQEALAEKAIGFNCLHYHAQWNEGTLNVTYIRDKTFLDGHCPDGLRAEIVFPSCWDGVRLDSPDHQDHVRYPDRLESGRCPLSHPVYLPIVLYEAVLDIARFRYFDGRFVMSNGDPTGFGYHGDFLAAWDEGALERAAADPTCTDQDVINPITDGQVQKCSSFQVQAAEEAASCKLAPSTQVPHESTSGILTMLPGDIAVTGVRYDPRPVGNETHFGGRRRFRHRRITPRVKRRASRGMADDHTVPAGFHT